MFHQHFPLELLNRNAVQRSGISEHLGNDRSPRFCVIPQFGFDDDRSAVWLDGKQVRIPATEKHLAAQDDQPGRTAEREKVRGLGDEVVQRLFVWEAGGLERRPFTVRTLLLPDGRHELLQLSMPTVTLISICSDQASLGRGRWSSSVSSAYSYQSSNP